MNLALVKSLSIMDLNRIRGIANYQFKRDVGVALFPDGVRLTHSRKTGRIRHIYLNEQMLSTLRPMDGLFSLTIAGGRRLAPLLEPPKFRVVVQEDVRDFIVEGRNVFSRHVVTVDQNIKAGEEVIVTSGYDSILAVGKALLTGREMLAFKRGIAVKVRRGIGED
ncbi:MAG: hypothetical protein QG670_1256 [Thermoproteota archaeon]|nr:hypothetical protein [Thermoproteota archaeon]